MKHSLVSRCVALAAVTLAVAACTMKEQEPAPLAGPSEFGQSLNVSVTPDVLTQDGASQSVVTVTARGTTGSALPSVSLRAEILVNGVASGFGTLSARNIVTDANGRVTVVYTAPASPSGLGVVESTLVTIAVTPNGSDFGNSVTRTTTLRLVPTDGIVVPPAEGLAAAFTFSPEELTEGQTVTFDGSGSTAARDGSPIVTYRWDFGDNGSATGVSTTHVYTRPGQYTATLSVIDGLGRARSTSRTVTVGLSTGGPTPIFNFSPAAPSACQDVFFNANGVLVGPGRRIVSYLWVFGDGTTSSTGPLVTKRYTNSTTRVFNVTLTITDDLGRSATSSPLAVTVTNALSTPCS